jgi:hypothetical protein
MAPTQQKIPSWHRLVPPRAKKKPKKKRSEPLSLEEEESYLRTRSYHSLSRQIDRAVENSLQSLAAESFHEELGDLLDRVKPVQEVEATPSPSKPARTDSSQESATDTPPPAELHKLFSVEPSQSFPPSLLPVLVLSGPSSRLDRHGWINHFVRFNRKERPRSCTVWLLSSTPGLNVTWQEEVTRQCLMQEPNLPSALRSKQFLGKASLTDTLLEWARSTTNFDDITIFLEVEDESFYSSALQDFIHWTAERRAQHGLPFILILLGPHTGRRQLELRSSSQGPVGLLVRHCILPSTVDVFDTLWEELWLEQKNPVAFPAQLLNHLGRMYREHSGSAIDVVIQIKMWLAHRLCQRWSFLLAVNVIPKERNRIRWFLVKAEARSLHPVHARSKKSLLQWIDELELMRRRGCIAMQVQQCLQRLRGASVPFLFLSARTPLVLDVELDAKERKSVLSLLLRLRRQVKDGTSGYHFNLRNKSLGSGADREMTDIVNELIILCDNCYTCLDMDKCLARYKDDWARHTRDVTGSSTSAAVDSELAALDVQPRRHSMRGLLDGLPTSNPASPTNLVHLVGNMFKLIQDRITVLQSEWFEVFRQTFALEASFAEALVLFGYGIYHLKLCGLLREKRVHGKNDVRYEKALLVWCSGE